jgi:hypothetical protein
MQQAALRAAADPASEEEALPRAPLRGLGS